MVLQAPFIYLSSYMDQRCVGGPMLSTDRTNFLSVQWLQDQLTSSSMNTGPFDVMFTEYRTNWRHVQWIQDQFPFCSKTTGPIDVLFNEYRTNFRSVQWIQDQFPFCSMTTGPIDVLFNEYRTNFSSVQWIQDQLTSCSRKTRTSYKDQCWYRVSFDYWRQVFLFDGWVEENILAKVKNWNVSRCFLTMPASTLSIFSVCNTYLWYVVHAHVCLH